jgi:hypothetical protein
MIIDATMVREWSTGGEYHANITGLDKDQVYWVRGYEKLDNWDIVGYNTAVPFATRKDYANDYNGEMPFSFSVAPDKQVHFSMGNLQYRASTDTWRFAEYQFEYVGDYEDNRFGFVYANGMHPDASQNGEKSDNANRSESYNQWIDLFCWGTSGYNHGAVCYQPWSVSGQASDLYAYGDPNYNLNSSTGKADWGYNAISNGGNTENSGWRTLQGSDNGLYTDEWDYLLNSRPDTYRYALSFLIVRGVVTGVDDHFESYVRYSIDANTEHVYSDMHYGSLNRVSGLVVFPDGFEWPSELGTSRTPWAFNGDLYPYNDHDKPDCFESSWSILEHYGAVFLPCAGPNHRHGSYCSSTSFVNQSNNRYLDRISFYVTPNFPNNGEDIITLGPNGNMWPNSWSWKNTYSVRLVKDVQ